MTDSDFLKLGECHPCQYDQTDWTLHAVKSGLRGAWHTSERVTLPD
jgi:hypothetical protein